jgi:hypothetical protein
MIPWCSSLRISDEFVNFGFLTSRNRAKLTDLVVSYA